MSGLSLMEMLALVEEAHDDCIGSRGDHDDYVAAKALGSLSYVIRRKAQRKPRASSPTPPSDGDGK